MNTCIVCTHLKCLAEALLTNVHNIRFHAEKKKNINSFQLKKKSVLSGAILNLKAPFKLVTDGISVSFYYFSEKTRLDFSCESSAMQMIHMKCQALRSQEN